MAHRRRASAGVHESGSASVGADAAARDAGASATASLLRDLSASIPGAFYRFRRYADGEYRLDSISSGFRSLAGLADDVDLTDFSEWVRRIPEAHVGAFLESIQESWEHLTAWTHEWPMDVPVGRIWLQGMSQPHLETDGSVVWNGLLLDITRRRQAEEERARVETDYRSVFENTTEGIFRTSPEGRLLDANGPLVRMHGFTSKQALLDAVKDLATDYYVHPEDRTRILALLDRDGFVEGFEAEVKRIGTGERFRQQENVRVVRGADGAVLCYQGTVRDVTEQYRARRLALHRADILEKIARDEPLEAVLGDIVSVLEAYHRGIVAAVMRVSDGWLEVAAAPRLAPACVLAMEGLPSSGIGGAIAEAVRGSRPVATHVDPRAGKRDGGLHGAMVAAGYRQILVVPMHDRAGGIIGLLAAFAAGPEPLKGELGTVLHEMAQISAIALEQAQLSQLLIEQAQYDALTGLPNRVLMEARMNQVMAEARRSGHTACIMLLDLDEFKLVNDTLGHDAGDALLCAVSSRLQSCVRGSDTVARFGGDEFVVVLPIAAPDRARSLAERLIAVLNDPFDIRGTRVTARPSIGISLFPQDGVSVDNLLRAADTAMYAAKRAGRNRYRFFDDTMNQAVNERLRIGNELHDALRSGQLQLHFQPLVRLRDGAITGAEALLRWQHPERGLVAPGNFLPIAEQIGMTADIDRYVLRAGAETIRAWRRDDLDLELSLNLCASALHRDGFGSEMASLLTACGDDGSGLEIEITETAIMQDFDRAAHQLNELRRRAPGVRIALDDFGTGYSSLQYLARLPIDTLKIDQSFVADLSRPECRATAETITRAIIDLGRNLGLRVIAEGIESSEQTDLLLALGCEEGQGYWFARPMAMEHLIETVRPASRRD